MAVLQYRTLSNRTVAALSVERDTVFWDRDLTGFGVRVYPSAAARSSSPRRAVRTGRTSRTSQGG